MRGVDKADTLESRLPIYKVEQDCLVSKLAEITVAFRVNLREIFTMPAQDYEALHQLWVKALRILPNYTIVHKQDWFVEEQYAPDFGEERTFLSRAFERHFNERPFLNHYCYLYLTLSYPERARKTSIWSSVVRGHLVPRDIPAPGVIRGVLDTVSQFQRIL